MTRRLEIAQGARAGEERLLELLREHLAAARKDPALLGRAVRVIVPSGALRRHLIARMAAELGATAGIEVRTLYASALEVLGFARLAAAQSGEKLPAPTPKGDLLFELLARREAAQEEYLNEALEGLEAGYRAALETVRDLQDAGFEPAHAGGLAERLPATGTATSAAIDRARAILNVASRTGEKLEGRFAELPATLFAEAQRCVERGTHGFDWSALFIHGFADVTGRAGDFLEALFRRFPATVLLEEPPDPAEPTRPDLGCAFAERMRQRFEGQAQEITTVSAHPAPELTFVRTPGPGAEARAVVERVQERIASGLAPERIAICARDLAPHKSALRSQLERLGIPFSAPGTSGLVDGSARSVLALLELMRKKGRTNAQRWIDASLRFLFGRVSRRPCADLRLALRAAGGGRLEDVARLDVPALLDRHGTFALPARTGLRSAKDPEADTDQEATKDNASRRITGTYAPRRRFGGKDLATVVHEAQRVLQLLDGWPEHADIQVHLARFADLRHKHLCWHSGDPAEERIAKALDELGRGFVGEKLSGQEFQWLLERSVLPNARTSLSPGESGVQLLGAMAARAHTFEHLFLIGLQRDAFPRVVGEDPLLPDNLRGAWSELLPDIPIKARGRDEERYLFAQLLGSAPRVTLSWQTNDAEGKARVLSPLLERMSIEHRDVEDALPLIPTNLENIGDFFESGPRPLDEHAALAGLVGGPQALQPLLAPALIETQIEGAQAAAEARSRVLSAFEARDPERLLPFLGWLGAQKSAPLRPDPVEEPLFITRIEDAVDCPWRLALSKILRLEEAPDPLERLPGIEPRILGSLVHEVLERLARVSWGENDQPQNLQEAITREPVPTKWPSPKAIEHLTDEIAQELFAREGIHEPGLCRLICHVALPHIQRGQTLLSEEAERYADEEETSGCLGVELLGQAEAELPDGEKLRVRFKADRVDRIGERLILSDFKTGRMAVGESEFLKKLIQGKNLQPSAYVHGVESDRKVRARLLYLNPAVDEERQVVLLKKESHSADDWLNALAPVRDIWHAGVFFPRLTDPSGKRTHDRCRLCDVSSACLQGDSSARTKLVELAHGERKSPELEAMGRLWDVPSSKKDGEASR